MTDPPIIDAQGKPKHATDPRTNAGKHRSSRNASRHDLSTPVRADPHARAREDQLADLLTGPNADAWRREQAAAVADAQIDFMRVRAAKVGILERMFQVGSLQYHESIGHILPDTVNWMDGAAVFELSGQDSASANAAAREIGVFRRLFPECKSWSAMKGRAFSRRKFALRTFGGFNL
jgi:hypothetical protein